MMSDFVRFLGFLRSREECLRLASEVSCGRDTDFIKAGRLAELQEIRRIAVDFSRGINPENGVSFAITENGGKKE